ncbi:hypothetical protein AVEN_40279-1 [Araneus ventricosus]|uniref:Uncharacterized protein n=1 Tax=Araneus ventricosus TaxID=182803 RepID=A0A4Y2NPL1_ARAVE|nr:hypothetical protein AVEN_40279-1 [Araneus ventricosus]
MPALDWWKKFKRPVTSLVGRGVATSIITFLLIPEVAVGTFVNHLYLFLPFDRTVFHSSSFSPFSRNITPAAFANCLQPIYFSNVESRKSYGKRSGLLGSRGKSGVKKNQHSSFA